MKTDRELLELAARAAGYIPTPDGMEAGEGGPMSKGGLVFAGNGECIDWNPLTDDGDALRLAVKLHMEIVVRAAYVSVTGDYGPLTEMYSTENPKEAATRRAIVRAAAEIGTEAS